MQHENELTFFSDQLWKHKTKQCLQMNSYYMHGYVLLHKYFLYIFKTDRLFLY